MNRTEWLTDEILEMAFEQRAGSASMSDIGDAILARTAATRQRSGWRVRLAGILPRPAGPPAWVAIAVLVALLAVAVALALIGQRPQTPFRTGLLAFIRGGDVYLAQADGSDLRVALHQDGVALSTVAWSPDGRHLAIDGDSGGIVLDVSTGSTRFVGGGNPVWSPDGQQLAVVDPAGDAPARLRIVDVTSGTTTRTYPFPAIGGLAWSPNGRWIAATGGTSGASNSLIRIDVSTGDVIELDGPSGMLDSAREAAWSPDSAHVAFIRWGETHRECVGSPLCETDVFVADADGSGPVQLNTVTGQADQPSWSPDGRWIAYRQVARSPVRTGNLTTIATSQAVIAIAHTDGTSERVIGAEGVGAFAWSPEGDRLRYTDDKGNGRPAVVWETTLDGVKHSLGVLLDAGDLPFETSGFGAAWQTLARTAAAPTMPSIAQPTPATSPDLRTPAAAAPADPGATWPLIASDSNEGCQPVLIATRDGATTAVGDPCDLSQGRAEAAWSPTGSVYGTLEGSRLSILHRDGEVDTGVGGLSGLTSFSWSPRGTWLSVLGEQTSILRVDGSALRALPGTPSWSADERLLAVAGPEGTLLVGGGDGSALRPVGSFPAYITWSSHGSRFAFVRDGDVWTAAPDGSDVTDVTAFPLGGATAAFWSRDDQWLAVATMHGVWIMRPDGKDRRLLAFGPATFFYDAHWSPGSNTLAVDTYTDRQSGQDGAIYLVHADGSPTIRIDAATGSSWSPDGRYLAVTAVVANGGFETGDYELMNADGSGRHRLPTKAGQYPAVWVVPE